MSIPTALQFIQHLQTDQTVQKQYLALKQNSTLMQVVDLASQAGFVFSTDDLRAAHKHHWTMRWLVKQA